jgi:hypothetical protein
MIAKFFTRIMNTRRRRVFDVPVGETVVASWNASIYDTVQAYAERVYGTANDPTQIPVNDESYRRIISISPDTLLYLADGNGNLLA